MVLQFLRIVLLYVELQRVKKHGVKFQALDKTTSYFLSTDGGPSDFSKKDYGFGREVTEYFFNK